MSDFHCVLWASTNEHGSVFKFKIFAAEHTFAQIDMIKHVFVFGSLKSEIQNLSLFAIIDIRKMDMI